VPKWDGVKNSHRTRHRAPLLNKKSQEEAKGRQRPYKKTEVSNEKTKEAKGKK